MGGRESPNAESRGARRRSTGRAVPIAAEVARHPGGALALKRASATREEKAWSGQRNSTEGTGAPGGEEPPVRIRPGEGEGPTGTGLDPAG